MKYILLSVLLLTAATSFAQVTRSSAADTAKSKRHIMMFTEQMPQFPGGEQALQKFLNGNIKYPAEARKNKVEGTVVVKFVVNEDGSLTDITVSRGLEGGCSEEALRVMKLIPKWNPGKQNGVVVPVYFNLPVMFSLK